MADISKIKTPDGMTYDISVNHDHAIKSGQTIYNVTNYYNNGSALETVIYTGIKFVSSTHMPLVRLKGYAYGKGKTTELIIALYIYQDAFYSSRTVTNLGVWTPDVYLFTYEKNSTKYVAIGLAGSIYFNMFSVDVQDEMGKFRAIDRDGWAIESYTEAGTIPAVGTDDCVSVNYGVNILNPPNAENAEDSYNLRAYAGNEVTIGNNNTSPGSSTNNAIYINYRDRHNGTKDNNSTAITDYYFCNRKGSVAGVKLHSNIVETGSYDDSYFQSRRFRGEGDASLYYHAVDFGYAGHNQVDFYEYGGIFNFHKHTNAAIDSGDTLLGTINTNGWEGKVNGHTVNSDVPANAKFTDTTYSGTSPISINSSNQVSIATASTSAYGATKLSTATNSTAVDVAATPSAVKTAYDLANSANGTANTALSGVNGNLIYDQTFTISNGVATFTPHVYQKGQEVTTNYAKSCFVWKYRLVDGSEVSLTTNDNRGCTVTISGMGYGGHVIGAFTPS